VWRRSFQSTRAFLFWSRASILSVVQHDSDRYICTSANWDFTTAPPLNGAPIFVEHVSEIILRHATAS
jgi:hypothetical protein